MAQSEPSSQPNPTTISNETRRDILIEQLTQETYECMVCYEKVLRYEPIWNCQKCYSVFHLICIHKWAMSSRDEGSDTSSKKWRCPGCQTQSNDIPYTCRCFCGGFEYPETVSEGYLSSIPHSCGLKCNRVAIGSLCPHPCALPCHPGPCPPCSNQVIRNCNCGKTMINIDCGSETNSCGILCQDILKCGKHRCIKPCHTKPCGDCNFLVEMDCHCGNETKIVSCSWKTRSATGNFSCGGSCKDSATFSNADPVVNPPGSVTNFERISHRVKSRHEDYEGNTPSDIECFLCCCLPCASVSEFCLKILSVSMSLVGFMYMDDCPQQPALTTILIFMGVLTVIGQIVDLLTRPEINPDSESERTDSPNKCLNRLSSTVNLLLICNYLYFCVIVYRMDKKYVQENPYRLFYAADYCDKNLYNIVNSAFLTSLGLSGFVIAFYFWSLLV